MTTITPMPVQIEAAAARRKTFIGAISPALSEAEDKLPQGIRRINASPRSKLQKVYAIADELSTVRAPYVACREGCASCCKMNVKITAAEAERISRVTGRKPSLIRQSLGRHIQHFAGVPCPFLGEREECSIYADRPLSCRTHASFFEDASTCAVDVMYDQQMPLVKFDGLSEALFLASDEQGQPVLADIRDFFPDNAIK